ncbi:MAG: flagellar basal body rod protein FlgC [Anaerolineae bacterium]|nr:flagellar basal body rod protein FlgC [Anaerolineae bacterium]
MSVFTALRISASALTAERLRMDVIADNIANQQTTRTAEGGPYRRKAVVFRPIQPSSRHFKAPGLAKEVVGEAPVQLGVRVTAIVEDPRPGPRVYDPDHPDADPDGYVTYPNVDVVSELIDMMAAKRAYEVNVITAQTAKSMAMKALDIGR